MATAGHRWWLVVLLVVGLGMGGCVGVISDVGGSEGGGDGAGGPGRVPTPEECAVAEPTPGATPLRRLSHTEYRNVIRDAFPGVAIPSVTLAADDTDEGFENSAALNTASPLLVENYETAAALISEALAADVGAWLTCGAGDCAAELIDEVALRLMRRPLDDAQRAAYLALFREQEAAIDYDAAVELTLYAMLQSPELLYRVEAAVSGAPGEVVALDGYEIAARLSFLILGSIPDDALLARVDELDAPDVREEEARRLLDDPRATARWVDFSRQWLELDRVASQDKEPGLFPTWTDSLRDAIREESLRFVDDVMSDEATLDALLLSTEAPVNAELAALYGVEAPASGWAVRTLPADERAGILTRASFLASHAHASNGSPPLRGVAVLTRWLCQEIPEPPADADTSTPVSDGVPATNRELFEERTSPDTCQGCHRAIDGIGFGFENYDAIGAFRVTDNGMPVDATGAITTAEGEEVYDGAVELSAALAESQTVRECVSEQWFRFAAGREAEVADTCRLRDLTDVFTESGGDFRELLVELVRRPDFALRTVTPDATTTEDR